MNKKGDIPTLFYVIVIVFATGLVLFTLSHVNRTIYGSLDTYFDTSTYNDTEAHRALNKVQVFEQSMWDYVFLGIFMGYILLLLVLSYSVRINNIFFWIFVFASLFGLFIGVVLSNSWEQYANNPQFATTLASFPIMNAILGYFYPIFVTVIIATMLIILFGKFGGGDD